MVDRSLPIDWVTGKLLPSLGAPRLLTPQEQREIEWIIEEERRHQEWLAARTPPKPEPEPEPPKVVPIQRGRKFSPEETELRALRSRLLQKDRDHHGR
jgi:hypothetical protein